MTEARPDPQDPRRAEALLPVVYEELKRLARARMAHEDPGHTLQTTALVHEAYLRLVGRDDVEWNGPGHFFGAAAQAMRRILVEEARRRARLKRGGGHDRIPLAGDDLAVEPPGDEVLQVDEAMKQLEACDPRKGEIVNLRYFAGLTEEETAAALHLSVQQVQRQWRFIRSWLQRALGDP